MSARTPTEAVTQTLDELAGIYGDLYAEWLRATTRLLEVFDFSEVANSLPALPALAPPRTSTCGCEIPPACWTPLELADVSSIVCPRQTATLSLRIVNRSVATRTFTVTPGSESAGLSIASSPLALGPMEEGTVVVTYTAGDEAGESGEHRFLLWIRGCRAHLQRWTVTIGGGSTGTCRTVDVVDEPDNLHHWYDHFYCAHPCAGHHG
jgi:hypothetical protein